MHSEYTLPDSHWSYSGVFGYGDCPDCRVRLTFPEWARYTRNDSILLQNNPIYGPAIECYGCRRRVLFEDSLNRYKMPRGLR